MTLDIIKYVQLHHLCSVTTYFPIYSLFVILLVFNWRRAWYWHWLSTVLLCLCIKLLCH